MIWGDGSGPQPTHSRTVSVYVYEVPLRVWHWVTALCVVVLIVSGYLIGAPLPSAGGEASSTYVTGIVRTVHFATAQILTIAMLGRIYWAFVGNRQARHVFFLPLASRHFWDGILFEIRWYLFLEKEPRTHVGHNPLAQLAMVTAFMTPIGCMIFSGFAMYGEGTGEGSLAHVLFGWVLTIFGNSDWLHQLHRLGMWGLVCFIVLHVYSAIREDIMSNQDLISTIINGNRTFKEEAEIPHSPKAEL